MNLNLLIFLLILVAIVAMASMAEAIENKSCVAKLVRVTASDPGLKQILSNHLVPPLTATAHKGQMGRIGVVGGSVDFTGAPYYAASSSLKFGGDLAYVFTAKQAVLPIKSYSPECMVTPFYDDDLLAKNGRVPGLMDDENYMEQVIAISNKIIPFLPRLHSLVVGPGLGRNTQLFHAVTLALEEARSHGLPLVMDADALFMLADGNDLGLSAIIGYPMCVLTPNKMEFKLLCSAALRLISSDKNIKVAGSGSGGAVDSSDEVIEGLQSEYADLQVQALARALRVTVLLKGADDLICDGSEAVPRVFQVQAEGSMRRCGGQGDLLAGSLAVALHWASSRKNQLKGQSLRVELRQEQNLDKGDKSDKSDRSDKSDEVEVEEGEGGGGGSDNDIEELVENVPMSPTVLAALLSSLVVKQAAQYAFQDKRRSMTTPDILNTLGPAFEDIVEESFHSTTNMEYD